MAVLTSQVERESADFERRAARMEELVRELRGRTALVAVGGGAEALERHRSRGKLTARERIDRLCDPDTAFLELNALAAWEMYDGQAPAAGMVTGIAGGGSSPHASGSTGSSTRGPGSSSSERSPPGTCTTARRRLPES